MKSLILTNDWGYFYNNQKQDVAGEWVHLTTSDFAELLLWTENMIEKGGQ